MAHTAPSANRPYKSVQVRTSPYSLAPTLCIAQCALPARGNTLYSLEKAMHMAHGGKPHFSPRVLENAQGRTLFLPGVREKHGFYERICEGMDYLSMTEASEE